MRNAFQLLFGSPDDVKLLDIFLPALVKWNMIAVTIAGAGFLPIWA